MQATRLLVAVAIAAPFTDASAQSVTDARNAYRQVEHDLGSYRRVRHDLMGFSTEGGYLDAWFEGAHVRKLLAMYYGETFRGSDAYYFANDSLVFVFGRYERHDRPHTGHVIRVDRDRAYFQGGHLIRWVDSTHTQRTPTSAEAQERGRDLLSTAPLLVACARASTSDRAACTGPY